MSADLIQSAAGFPRRHSRLFKTAVLFAVLLLGGLAFAIYDRAPNLSHLQVRFLSGHASGNYFAIVERLSEEAARQRGKIVNRPSAGTVDNINRLATGRITHDVNFALVQDGMEWPPDGHFELIGRLGRPESFVLLGRDADRLHTVA